MLSGNLVFLMMEGTRDARKLLEALLPRVDFFVTYHCQIKHMLSDVGLLSPSCCQGKPGPHILQMLIMCVGGSVCVLLREIKFLELKGCLRDCDLQPKDMLKSKIEMDWSI